MQGGRNSILPKEINTNRFLGDSPRVKIWKNHSCPSMGPKGGSVAMDSDGTPTVLKHFMRIDLRNAKTTLIHIVVKN
jgi:hypothetical protein